MKHTVAIDLGRGIPNQPLVNTRRATFGFRVDLTVLPDHPVIAVS
jgi:hypothetical protein